MGQVEDLQKRIDAVLLECKALLKLFDSELTSKNAVPFEEVKAIGDAINVYVKKGLKVPDDLRRLKIELVSSDETHKELINLHDAFVVQVQRLFRSDNIFIETPRVRGKSRNKRNSNAFKYEKELGRRGNSNLEDYLIPIIKLMASGSSYQDAFRAVAEKLDVRYNTVSSQCTRALGLTTDEFDSQVRSGEIIKTLEVKYPDKRRLMQSELSRQK